MISALWCHGPGGGPGGSESWGSGQEAGGFLGNKISTFNHSLTSSLYAVCCFSCTVVMLALRALKYHMRSNTAFMA